MAIEIIDGFKVNKAVPIDTQRTVVATLADRNAIPATIRYEGMETRVVATRTKYVLEGGIANTNWKPMVNSSIPDYAFSSIEEIRTLDLSYVDSAVDVWLYPNRVYEWDLFSLLPDNGDTIIKPDGIANDQAGRFVLRAELAVKNHTHLPEPSHYDNGIVSENGKVRLGGRISQKREFVFDNIFDLSQTVFNSSIRAFVKLNNGKYLVGGQFTMCNGTSASYIARLNADGSLDTSFDLYVDGIIRGFRKLSDGSILVFGEFFTVNYYNDEDGSRSVMTGQLLKLTPECEYDASFVPTVFNTSIYALGIQSDGKLIVGGAFTGIYNSEYVVTLTVGRIARLMPNGGIDQTFITGTQFSSANASVYAICLNSDDGMMIGGRFTTYNSVSTPSIIMLDKDGNRNPSFVAKTLSTGTVYDIKQTDSGDYLVAGSFGSYAGNYDAARIIRVLANGDLDTAFNRIDFDGISTDQTVMGLIDVDGSGAQFYAYGSFNTINGTASSKIAIIDATTGMVNQDGFISPFAGYTSNMLSAYDTGEFLFVAMTTGAPFIGAIRYNGSFYSEMANLLFDGYLEYKRDLSDHYSDMALIHKAYLHDKIRDFIADAPNDSGLYVRQNLLWSVLKLLNGLSYNNGKVTLGGDIIQRTTLTNTKTRLCFENGFVISTSSVTLLCIALLPSGDYVISGRNLVYNGISKNTNDHLVKINKFGEYNQAFIQNLGSGTSTDVYFVLPLADGKMLVHGGQFLNGINKNFLFKLNSDGTLDTSFNAQISVSPTTVFRDTAIQLSTGDFVVTYYQTSHNICKINGATGAVVADYIANGRAFNGIINGLVKLPNDGVLVFGMFTTYYGETMNRIAKFNALGNIDRSFNVGTGFDSSVEAASVQPDGKILILGSFKTYNGTAVQHIVRLNADGTLDATFNPSFQNLNGGTLAFVKTLPDGRIIIGGNFRCADNINYLRVLKSDGSWDMSFCGGKTPTSGMATGICIQADKMTIIGQFSSYLENSAWVTVNGIANIDFNGQLVRDFSKFSISGFPIEYGEDQSQNFTDRSLVDKGFVATQLVDKVRRKEFKSIAIVKDTPVTITHNLGIRTVRATVYDESTWAIVACDTTCIDINKVNINVSKSNIASSTIIIEG
jgi:uncharacterized delta-60 repeat protein